MMTAQRVGVFVDVQNMFYAAKKLHQSKVDYGKLLKGVVGDRQLVRAIAYIVQKADIDQSNFHDALCRFGYELRVKELKIREDGEGRNIAKGNWDVGMTVEIMQLASKLDVVILISGDNDLLPLVECLAQLGVRVELVGFVGSTATQLSRSCHFFTPIAMEWTFKEKKFDQEARGGNSEPQDSGPISADDIINGKFTPPDEA
jgi:uncharacterized LabA/DUF88 family protein